MIVINLPMNTFPLRIDDTTRGVYSSSSSRLKVWINGALSTGFPIRLLEGDYLYVEGRIGTQVKLR